MKLNRKSIGLLIGTATVAVFALAFAVAMPQAASANGGPGGLGGRGMMVAGSSGDTYLADALGITVAELQTAQQKAYEAALAQAVEKGLITQAQADALKQRGDYGHFGFGKFGWFGLTDDNTIDTEALLADALGISVDDLQAARTKANDAALAQAVTDGRITQEQADQMKAEQALRQYFDKQGLADQVRSLYEQAVQNAVKAGVITQAQADQILSQQGPGFGMHGFGMPGFGGRGFGGDHFSGGRFGGRGFPGQGTSNGQGTGLSTSPTSLGL